MHGPDEPAGLARGMGAEADEDPEATVQAVRQPTNFKIF
jgi:hypothetical protein